MIKNKINLFIALFSVLILIGCSNSSVKKENSKEEKFLVIRGINLAESGKLEEALMNFKKAYKINDKNILTVRSIGLAYSKLGDSDKGMIFFEEALKINPTDAETLFNLGVLYFNKKQYSKSIELIDRINVESYFFDAGKLKALSYYELENYEKCINEIERMLSLKEKKVDLDVYGIYTNALEKNGDKEKIYPFLYRVFRKNRKNKNILFMIFDYFEKNRAYDSAERIIKEYGAENGFDYDIIMRMVKLEYNLGNYKKALSYFDLLEKEDQYSIEVLEMKVILYEILGFENKAVEIKKILNK